MVRKELIKRIALERMRILFNLGMSSVRKGDIALARRYGTLIYRIAMRVRVKIPTDVKRWICKRCKVIMLPGVNAMVRTRREGKTLRVVTRCLSCGWIHRYEFLRCQTVETKGAS